MINNIYTDENGEDYELPSHAMTEAEDAIETAKWNIRAVRYHDQETKDILTKYVDNVTLNLKRGKEFKKCDSCGLRAELTVSSSDGKTLCGLCANGDEVLGQLAGGRKRKAGPAVKAAILLRDETETVAPELKPCSVCGNKDNHNVFILGKCYCYKHAVDKASKFEKPGQKAANEEWDNRQKRENQFSAKISVPPPDLKGIPSRWMDAGRAASKARKTDNKAHIEEIQIVPGNLFGCPLCQQRTSVEASFNGKSMCIECARSNEVDAVKVAMASESKEPTLYDEEMVKKSEGLRFDFSPLNLSLLDPISDVFKKIIKENGYEKSETIEKRGVSEDDKDAVREAIGKRNSTLLRDETHVFLKPFTCSKCHKESNIRSYPPQLFPTMCYDCAEKESMSTATAATKYNKDITLKDIKSLANIISKKDGTPYMKALNEAAGKLGYRNYNHAEKTFKNKNRRK
jgi:hypothetical protein